MFEALFVLTLFGLLYVDLIEFLAKCDHPHPGAVRAVLLEPQAPRRLA